jgi:periplasmic protein CpxP/Spy
LATDPIGCYSSGIALAFYCVRQRTDENARTVGECVQKARIPTENVMKMIAAVLVSTFVFGSVNAQAPDHLASLNGAIDSPSPTMANSDAKRDAEVEKHIKDLHGKLKITPAEESQWNVVAETMRANARELDRAIDRRDSGIASATAIDNLNSYADIAQVHANNVKKLASAFAGLYSTMSEDQRKEADVVFSHHGHDGGHHGHDGGKAPQ